MEPPQEWDLVLHQLCYFNLLIPYYISIAKKHRIHYPHHSTCSGASWNHLFRARFDKLASSSYCSKKVVKDFAIIALASFGTMWQLLQPFTLKGSESVAHENSALIQYSILSSFHEYFRLTIVQMTFTNL